MIFDKLSLNGFKSFKNQDITLSQLTLLTGINSSGKSSIVHALRMLNQAYRHENPILPGYGDVDELKNRDSAWPITITGWHDSVPAISMHISGLEDIISELHPSALPELDLTYISASRFGPQNHIAIDTSDRIGELGENILKSIDTHQDDIIPDILRHPDSEGETLLFNLRAWINAISPGTKFTHEIIKHADTSYMEFNGFRSSNVGFGLSYTLPVIASLLVASVKKNQIVMIENPEAHLHPRAQTEMAQLICMATEAGVQTVVETHSDHLFDGVRIYARKHPGFANKTAIHWCEIGSYGNTKLESPRLLDNGKLESWPKGLFDQFEINADELL